MMDRPQFIALGALALAIIAPPLQTPLGVYGDPQIWLPVLACCTLYKHMRDGFLEHRALVGMAIMFLAVIFLSLVSSLLEGAGSVYGAIRFIKAFVMLVGLALLLHATYARIDPRIVHQRVGRWIFYVISLNGVIMVAQFASPEFLAISRSITMAGSYSNIIDDPTAVYRVPGLSLSGGAQISLFQSIAVILCPLLLAFEKGSLRALCYIALFIINLFAVVVSGRSGLYNIAIVGGVVLVLLVGDVRRLTTTGAWRRMVGFAIFAACCTGAVWLVANFPETAARIPWLPERFISAIQRNADFMGSANQSFADNSTLDTLLNDYLIWPSDLGGWLLGQPSVMENRGVDRLFDSDIGYVVSISAFGIINTFLQTLINATPLLVALRYRSRLEASSLPLAIILCSASVLLFNAKEVMFFARMAWPLQVATFFSLLYSTRWSPRRHGPFRKVALPCKQAAN